MTTPYVPKYPNAYSPPWAPHVQGSFETRAIDPETGLPNEARVEAHCCTCSADWQRTCSSGLMRQHINRFAGVHLHRDDPFTPASPLPSSGTQ